MKLSVTLTALLIATHLHATIVIDDFQVSQSLTSNGVPYPGTDFVQGAGIFGGERDLLIWNDLSGNATGSSSSGTFSYTQDASSSSEFTLIWGGTDSMASDSPRSSTPGLIDLLASNVTSIDVTYGNLSFSGTEIVVVRFDTSGGFFSHNINITSGDAFSTVQFDLADFSMGANASSVEAIWLEHGLFGQGASSIDITNVQFSTVPEPSTFSLLFLGLLMSGLLRRNISNKGVHVTPES